MKVRYCFVATLLMFSVSYGECVACETKNISIVGNIDANGPTAPAPNFVAGTTSFADLQSAAQLTTAVNVFDSVGQTHSLTVWLFHTAPAPGGTIVALVGADAGDIRGATVEAGYPILLARTMMDFGEDGTRAIFPGVDLDAEPAWTNGVQSSVYFKLDQFTLRLGSTALASISQDGKSGACFPRAAMDFDGDGQDDLVVWRPQYGMWAVLLSSTAYTQYIWKQWGLPHDFPMAGDYTGDGKADLVVWRPTDGNWFVCTSESGFDLPISDRATVRLAGRPTDPRRL